jgi:predicted RNA-binding protein with PUA-like domain
MQKEDHPFAWLFKEEPDHYNFADLERDKTTIWDGVTNNLARKHLRSVRAGDTALFYHTGTERAIVGDMQVVEGPMADPNSEDSKAVVVRVKVGKRWTHAVTLEEVKKDPKLANWDLVRLPRLSIVPVTSAQWERLQRLRKG